MSIHIEYAFQVVLVADQMTNPLHFSMRIIKTRKLAEG